MAAFQQNFLISQSDDCTTLTFTDTSNFGSNDEGYTYSTFTTKNIIIYDSLANVIVELEIVDSTPVTYSLLTSDMYLSIVYTLQIGSNTPLTKTYNVALHCFVDLKYGEIVAIDTIKCNINDDRLFNIVKGSLAAEIFASRGNGVLSQDCLNFANSYADDSSNTLNQSDCGCSK